MAKAVMIAAQALVLVGIGAGVGYWDHTRRPVMVTPPTMAPLPPAGTGEKVAPVTPDKTPEKAPEREPEKTPTEAPAVPPKDEAVKPAETPAAPTGEETMTAELVSQGHITVAQAFELFSAPTPAYFLDARRKDIFEAGHVRDAFRLPLEAFKGQEPAHFPMMPREETYVVYCEGGNCDESVAVQKQLVLAGYTKVYVMHAGYPGWVSAGHPTQTGEDPVEAAAGRP